LSSAVCCGAGAFNAFSPFFLAKFGGGVKILLVAAYLHLFLYSVRGLERSELGSHEIRPIHSAPSLGQSIAFTSCHYCVTNI